MLENAGLGPGETVLDVGCGEGLMGFGALDRGAGAVVFSDISQDLLDTCRESATALGLLERCSFVNASADDLSAVASGAVDVVVTRSVLIYVADKAAALAEFARVLRPGGPISLFEPVNRFGRRANSWAGYDMTAIADIASKIRGVYEAVQPPESDPMLDFDERDLVNLAERAGFFPVRLRLDAEIRAPELLGWDTFLNSAGNPRIPTPAEAMEHAQLSAEERERLTAHLRPLVEEGRGTWRRAHAFLAATKP